jgi:dTDP-4-dehydrorhamnose 3,5-epimerase
METLLRKIPTGFLDLWLLQARCYEDERGTFVKTYHAPTFRALDILFDPKEEFYSVSKLNVLRGMHFQLPPESHAKLVHCLQGRVLDVALDMRRSSATFGKSFSVVLSAKNRELLFIPAGFAHGFLALEHDTLMVYKTDKVHVPASDSGIAWNSFGFSWPVVTPLLSERDRAHVRWEDFVSPF